LRANPSLIGCVVDKLSLAISDALSYDSLADSEA